MAAEESLQTLELGAMFGSPLTALIDAQCQAAEATLRFVRAVGFSGDKLLTVPFQIPDRTDPEDKEPKEPSRIAVPILSLVPIPCVRVKEATIEFRAKIVAAHPTPRAERGENKTTAAPVRLRSVFAHRRQSEGSDHSRSYSLHVQIRAVQDELPPGLERLLGLLELPSDSASDSARPAAAPLPVQPPEQPHG